MAHSKITSDGKVVGLEREQLFARLKGQRVTVPDLQRTFSHWPLDVNCCLPELLVHVRETLDRLFPPGYRRQRYYAAEVALFAASWWPKASLERLKVATALSLWLFIWDDETDSQEFSILANDFKQCQTFREETVAFIRACLSSGRHRPSKPVNHYVIQYFEECAKVLAESCTEYELNTLLAELEIFVKMTEVEQRTTLSDRLPSVEEYQWRRSGSSAVGVCLAITEFCYEMELPLRVRLDPEMRDLWVYTNQIISVVNDMLSIKKEMEQNQLDSLLPLLYMRHGSIQEAMDNAMQLTERAVANFDATSTRLELRYADHEDHAIMISRFVEGCRHACTGNLDWSLSTGRYKLPVASLNGGLEIISQV